MSTVFIIDTSWLLELLRVPGKFDEQKSIQVRADFEEMINRGATFILPIAVLLETGNHIAQISEGSYRQKWANQLWDIVQKSRNNNVPFNIEPAAKLPELDQDIEFFAKEYAIQGVGLTDTQIIRISKEWKSKPGYKVHIWTFDNALKAREPDKDPEVR